MIETLMPLFLSILPIEAQAIPLPNALVTPPVTNMYRLERFTGVARKWDRRSTQILMLTANTPIRNGRTQRRVIK